MEMGEVPKGVEAYQRAIKAAGSDQLELLQGVSKALFAAGKPEQV